MFRSFLSLQTSSFFDERLSFLSSQWFQLMSKLMSCLSSGRADRDPIKPGLHVGSATLLSSLLFFDDIFLLPFCCQAAYFCPEMRRWSVSAACWTLCIIIGCCWGRRRVEGEEEGRKLLQTALEYRQLTEGGGTRRDEPVVSVVRKIRVFFGCIWL